MKVQEIMERIGVQDTGKAIAYIKDALDELNTISETHVTTQRIDITEDQRFYSLPDDAVKVTNIRCKNHLNSDGEYRAIPRVIGDIPRKDADGI